MTAYILILALGLVAGCVGGVIGTGSSIILLPVLVHVFGPKEAVPIAGGAFCRPSCQRGPAVFRLPTRLFPQLLDAVMVCSGCALIGAAVR